MSKLVYNIEPTGNGQYEDVEVVGPRADEVERMAALAVEHARQAYWDDYDRIQQDIGRAASRNIPNIARSKLTPGDRVYYEHD